MWKQQATGQASHYAKYDSHGICRSTTMTLFASSELLITNSLTVNSVGSISVNVLPEFLGKF